MKTFPPLTPGCLSFQPSSNPKNGTAWRDIVRNDLKFSPAYVGEALEQDAKLFCAAPDLLAALAECVTEEGAHCFSDIAGQAENMARRLLAINTIARAAIAKATA